MKKLNKKGFTLIEVIVVLAILAIMAAMAIPTMNGFIEEAKDSQYIAEARTAYVAAQFIATRDQMDTAGTGDALATYIDAVEKLADVKGEVTQIVIGGTDLPDTTVSKVVYVQDSKTYTWDITKDSVTVSK